MSDINKDIDLILNNKEDIRIKKLNKALKKYLKSRKLSAKKTQDLVSMMIVIFCLLDVSDEELSEFISRLNIIQLKRSGLMDFKEQEIKH